MTIKDTPIFVQPSVKFTCWSMVMLFFLSYFILNNINITTVKYFMATANSPNKTTHVVSKGGEIIASIAENTTYADVGDEIVVMESGNAYKAPIKGMLDINKGAGDTVIKNEVLFTINPQDFILNVYLEIPQNEVEYFLSTENIKVNLEEHGWGSSLYHDIKEIEVRKIYTNNAISYKLVLSVDTSKILNSSISNLKFNGRDKVKIKVSGIETSVLNLIKQTIN